MSEQPICERCGHKRGAHYSLNFSDGQHVSGEVLVCPTSTFQPAEVMGPRKENPPHGPLSERFMRHHYGARK